MKLRVRAAFGNAGLSLVEIMVGLAVGMIASLVIMQIFGAFITQQRTTVGTADAQTSGGVALYLLQREVQMAGYGLPVFDTANPALLCNTATDSSTGNTIDIWPITIVDGGAAAGSSDQIVIHYGDAQTGGSYKTNITYSGSSLNAYNTYFRPFMYASGPNNCPVTMGDCPVVHSLLHMSGAGCTLHPITTGDNIAVTTMNSLAYLGAWTTATFAVTNNRLTRNTIEVAANIVNVQAQYGISATASSNVVTQWVDATGGTWAAPTVNNRNRIKAVRVAVVARSDKPEGGAVTAACSSLTAAAPTGLCAWEGSVASPAPAIDLSNNADWQRYRYRVFETIIPLRNVIWSRNTLP